MTATLLARRGTEAREVASSRSPLARITMPCPNTHPPASEEQIALWAQKWMVMALEIFAGHRPRQQLQARTSPEVYETVDRRRRVLNAHSRRAGEMDATPVVVRALARTVRPGVHEVAVVTRDGHAVAAAALRVELFKGRLRVTALEI